MNSFSNSVFIESQRGGSDGWEPKYVKKYVFSKKLENYIDKNFNILIFDNLASTLLYYALKFRIPFLILIYEYNIKYFSKEFLLFINILKKENIIFNLDQIHLFESKLKKLSSKEFYIKEKNKINDIINNYNLN